MTPAERDRYSRQVLFAGIGETGQERLLRARVAIVGCGALGSFQAGALARAGVGYLRIVDRDYVELSNLQRQWLFEEDDARAALPKAVAAKRRLAGINGGVTVEAEVADLTPRNADELLGECDLILDATDNFETRYLINDYAVREGVSWIYGGAVAAQGTVMAMIAGQGPCLRCVYPKAPGGLEATCETAGVLNTATSLIASLQVTEAFRVLCGVAGPYRVTAVDLWQGSVRQIARPEREPACVCCGARRFEYLEGRRRAPISLCGRNAVQIHERDRAVDLSALAERLRPLGEVKANEFALRFFPAGYEVTVFPDGRAIIKGTTDTGVARSLYAQYVGS
ncbi:MAG: ThiF family adenylyltransferase [Bryobacteraceae bacterium]|nr:ThiF family adenylyltransferase [Bryobacteraceae bacterium]